MATNASGVTISVIGCGYLGAVHAASMAHLGHTVVGIDVDERKIAMLQRAEAPFFEPGLAEILADALATGRLTFTTDASQAARSQVHFVCVGTPQSPDSNAADLRYVDAAFARLLPHVKPGDVVVGKSTVPVGTAARLAAQLAEQHPAAALAWNPEFLREGKAVQDTLRPDRLVYGIDSDSQRGRLACEHLDLVYHQALKAGTPRIVTDYPTAELVKTAANSFLATKISFINAMAEICETVGADVVDLADSIGYDARIGRQFLNAGLGFGGGCLPKDIRAFAARADELGVGQSLGFLHEVDAINLRRRARMVDLASQVCDGSIIGRRIAVLGAAFKPNSDDVRDSPALDVAAQLSLEGADVVITDPQANRNGSLLRPDLKFVESVEEAAFGADVIMLLTEWAEYVALSPDDLSALVSHRRILDGRNALNPTRWRNAGWTYRALGRRP